jgi:hypothetical protein
MVGGVGGVDNERGWLGMDFVFENNQKMVK